MSKKVVLAEKPSVGRDIARVLKCTKQGNGYMEGDKYIVTWALGHLVTLADPEVYDDKYKTWRIEDLPMMPDHLKLIVIKRSGKQFQAVKSQLNRKDVTEIIVATDAGREGELVARWIIEKARVNKPIKRLWISSVTDQAIKDGFNKLKDGKLYQNLYDAAVARSEADWYVGLNATRALTCKHNAQLSCGRVQTPTLAMIARREEEIKQFNPKKFYGITASTNQVKFKWQDPQSKGFHTFSKEKSEALLKSLQSHKSLLVTDVSKQAKKQYAPQLYDLTELQRDAHKIFGYSAKETLSVLQKLYEHHKIVTYPRTDSRYISTDIVSTLKDRLSAISIQPYTKHASFIMKTPIKANRSFVDDQKVSDHHAIIPTEQTPFLNKLADKERKLYDLIVRRFLAILHEPYQYEQTTIVARIGNETFTTKGKRPLNLGWKQVYDHLVDDETDEGETDENLPNIHKGDTLPITTLVQTTGETKPPQRFNEGTLLSAMENPTQYMANESKELIKTIGKTGGLGTVATRADIIEKLFNTFLIEKRGKDLFITSKGKQLLDLVPEDLKSPALTADWEQKLEQIANGSLKKIAFIKEMKAYAISTVHEIKQTNQKFKHDNITGTNCPDCGKLMLEVKNKNGKMLVCQDRECGHRKNKMKVTNARCPNCRKKLELHGEGEGQMFICRCGHREKLSTFNERRKKDKQGKASKRDVNQYLKNQQKEKEEPINTALADQLKKFLKE